MVASRLSRPTQAPQKAWKARHSGVLVVLTRGASKTGRLSHELIQKVKNDYGYKSDRAIQNLWKKYKGDIMAGNSIRIQRSGQSGRKLIHSSEDLVNKIKNIPLQLRRTLRSMAFQSGIPKSTLHEYLRRGLLMRSTSHVKPKLSTANCERRKAYCKDHVDADGHFSDLMNKVHVDEKWFYIMRIIDKIYLLQEEYGDKELLYRACKHKSHIDKIMFGAAVARPRQNPETGEWWDGKIHLHPFIIIEAAQRNSRNRPAGTLETKSLSVNRVVYRKWICEYVIHAIVAQWPDWCPKDVEIQQDNAKPHIRLNDPEWINVRDWYALPENGGWNIKLFFQPPNSPDLNILDLAMFRAMQSIQQQHQTKNVNELIEVVKKCWNDFPIETSKKVWTTLQLVMDEVIKGDGHNNYKLPHMSKDKWVRENGPIPLRLPCTALNQQINAQQAAAPPNPPSTTQASPSTNTEAANEHGSDAASSAEPEELTAYELSVQAIAEEELLTPHITEELDWDDDAEGYGTEDEDEMVDAEV